MTVAQQPARWAIPGDYGERILIEFPWEVPLFDEEKVAFLEELGKLRALVEAGHFNPLIIAFEFCCRYQIIPPDWVHFAIKEKLCELGSQDRQLITKGIRRRIDRVRWATVKHFRESKRLSWDLAYAAASNELHGTSAGGEETMRASYKRFQHDPFISLLREEGRLDQIIEFACEIHRTKKGLPPPGFSYAAFTRLKLSNSRTLNRRGFAGGSNS